MRELDALPYDVLRSGTYPVEAAELLAGLADVDEMPFAPIRILLLGIDDGEIAREAIARRLAMMAKLRLDTNLGPWITAAIESGGKAGDVQVEQMLLTMSDRMTDARLSEVVHAYSVLSAQGDPSLRGALDAAIRRLVSLYPAAAPLIAPAFGANADYSQTSLVGELVRASAFTDLAGVMAAAAYMNGARKAEKGLAGSVERLQVLTRKEIWAKVGDA